MSKRVNISIPDELWEKLKQIKGDLNVSRICADAIKKALDNPSEYLRQNQIEKDRILKVIDGTKLSKDELLEIINKAI